MDLLDKLEDYSPSQFKPKLYQSIEQNENQESDHHESDESERESDPQQERSTLGFDFNISSITEAISKDNSNNEATNDLSILERIKRRINNEEREEDATQQLESEESGTVHAHKLPQLEIDESDFQVHNGSTQMIADKVTQVLNSDKTQVIRNDRTQVINNVATQRINYGSTQVIRNQSTQIIPTKNIMQGEDMPTQEISSSTQVINQPGDNLFCSESEDENDEAPLSKDQRAAKIQQLIEKRKQERLAKEREELEQDLTKESLTDEENDINNEANDTVVSSTAREGATSKELEVAQEFLNIQKRQIDIRPEFQTKVVFTKDKLLDAFSDDDNDHQPIQDKPKHSASSSLDFLDSSPITSPVKERPEDFLEIFKKNAFKPAQQTQLKNPLEVYAEKLKQKLFSSPSNEKTLKIDLDSDSDLEINNTSSPTKSTYSLYPTKFSNTGAELNHIPELTKDQRLTIKRKFLKKKYGSKDNKTIPASIVQQNLSHVAQPNQKKFLHTLQKRNIDQLKNHKLNDSEHAILEEMEKDEEVMGSLLEREMERVRNIRLREKMHEKAKLALAGKALGGGGDGEENDEQVGENDLESEVPDSDYDSVEDQVSDDEGDNELDEDEEEVDSHKRSRNVISDDEDEEQENKPIGNNPRSDDSYMFGGGNSDDDHISHDDDYVTTHPRPINDDIYTNKDSVHSYETTTLFQNLKPRVKNEFDDGDSQDTQDGPVAIERVVPVFKDISIVESQTQADTPTQADSTTQQDSVSYSATQIISDKSTQKDQDMFQDDDDDIVTPAGMKRGRKLIRNKNIGSLAQVKEEPVDDEDDQEAIQQRIKQYEHKIRKRELKLRKRRKELERKGLGNVLQGEAEESEDEWKGLGGADGEDSDVANSEDERMIDNNLAIDLKDEEIRKKFMEDYQIKDQKELEKLLDDVKNHRLMKRATVNNGFDIELSDEEDELLVAYRKQKLFEQQQRLMENKKLQSLSKNERSKAFFASIQDSESVIRIDSESEPESLVETIAPKEKTKQENEDEDSLENEAPVKKTIKLEESFVQKQLSFLNNATDDYEYERLQHVSKIQHGFDSEEEIIEDIQVLKSRSISNLTKGSRSESPAIDLEEESSKKRDLEDTDVDEEDVEFMPAFKKPSIVKSFRSFQEQQGVSIKDGKQHFSGVTVSKQYKVVSGSKASISYLAKNAQTKVKSLKEKNIERSLQNSKNQNKGLFKSSGFE
ncbi:uncharacterized protein J8A68_001128 [[Candida] subhashii]|uniref:DNA replication checkpoint mediator MRC1 domain-containing protein n=1 Tax=[Candida] subhashii TaxID=561895 RepID=A0A8J5R549_9ASCO|nr:uncharacterized protein J8A68_001128 [[Candida] subhashii]KAG7665440.1 hypothetical protein J8A68_001128 [[Candida] subhashii]